MARILTILICLCWSLSWGAQAPWKLDRPIQLGVQGVSSWVGEGKLVGGKSGSGFTILDVTLAPQANQEKWILTYGNFKGESWDGAPGFFQAVLSPDGKKLTLSLSQVSQTRRADVIPKLARASVLAQSIKVTTNLQDRVTYFELRMKRPVKMRLISDVKPSRQLTLELAQR